MVSTSKPSNSSGGLLVPSGQHLGRTEELNEHEQSQRVGMSPCSPWRCDRLGPVVNMLASVKSGRRPTARS